MADQTTDTIEEHEQRIAPEDHRPQVAVREDGVRKTLQFNLGTSTESNSSGQEMWVDCRSRNEKNNLGHLTWTYNLEKRSAKVGARHIQLYPHLIEFINHAHRFQHWEMTVRQRDSTGSTKPVNLVMILLIEHIYAERVVVYLHNEDRSHPDGRRRVGLKVSHPAFVDGYHSWPKQNAPTTTVQTPGAQDPPQPQGGGSVPETKDAPEESRQPTQEEQDEFDDRRCQEILQMSPLKRPPPTAGPDEVRQYEGTRWKRTFMLKTFDGFLRNTRFLA